MSIFAKTILLKSPAILVSVWIILMISNYYLTIIIAQFYRARFLEQRSIPNVYQSVPIFRGDVDSVRYFITRLLLRIVIGVGMIAGVNLFRHDVIVILLALIVLIQIASHVRHLCHLFRLATRSAATSNPDSSSAA